MLIPIYVIIVACPLFSPAILFHRFKNGGKYVGEYSYGKRQGEGTIYYPDGSRYEGSWSENARNGFGKYHYVNGDTYEGDWVNNNKEGQGIYTYADTGMVLFYHDRF